MMFIIIILAALLLLTALALDTNDKLSQRRWKRLPSSPGTRTPEDPWEAVCVTHKAILATLPDTIRADFVPESEKVNVETVIISGGKIVDGAGVVLGDPGALWTSGGFIHPAPQPTTFTPNGYVVAAPGTHRMGCQSDNCRSCHEGPPSRPIAAHYHTALDYQQAVKRWEKERYLQDWINNVHR